MKIFFLTLFILHTSSAWATDSTLTWQQWKKTWVVDKANDNFIYLQPNDVIRSVEVVDMRSDTSLLGLYTSSSQKPRLLNQV